MMRNNNYNQVANGIQRAFLLVFIVLCFSSTGQGTDQWMSLGPEGVATNSIAIHPLNSSTLYGGSNGDVVKSTDDGNTWNQILNRHMHLTQVDTTRGSSRYANPTTYWVYWSQLYRPIFNWGSYNYLLVMDSYIPPILYVSYYVPYGYR